MANKKTRRENLATAVKRKAKVAPRKARLVVDQIRGMNVAHALAVLDNTRRATNPIMLDLLKSAIANAMQKDGNVNPDELIITEARVDEGITLKRLRARAMGRGMIVRKKTSHITIAVG